MTDRRIALQASLLRDGARKAAEAKIKDFQYTRSVPSGKSYNVAY
jgi:hypothetical protein